MKIVGINFTKINAEKKGEAIVKSLKIKSNIDIADISEVNYDFLKLNESLLGVKFSYSISYDPDYAKIFFEGIVIFSATKEEANEILESWKDKKIPEVFKVSLFNAVLKKTNIKALYLEEELNLPTHIPMPSIKNEQ